MSRALVLCLFFSSAAGGVAVAGEGALAPRIASGSYRLSSGKARAQLTVTKDSVRLGVSFGANHARQLSLRPWFENFTRDGKVQTVQRGWVAGDSRADRGVKGKTDVTVRIETSPAATGLKGGQHMFRITTAGNDGKSETKTFVGEPR